MAEVKSIRLNKVLKEFNISLDRAVDFLKSKSVEIEARPTAKISDTEYKLLSEEFAKDKEKKVESKEVGEEKRKEKEGGKEEGEDTKQKQKEQTTEKKEVPVKRKFSDGEGEGEASAKRVANSEPKDSNDATPSKRKSVKPSDKGKAPKKLRDPDSVLVYLEGWATAVNEREEKGIASDAPGFKPSNGWKLDKNIQNWLLHNVFVPNEVDDDVFGMTVLYVGGLRGGPLERTRERAREMNVGKGVVPERARAVLRALHTGD